MTGESDQVGVSLHLSVLGAFAARHRDRPLDLPPSRKTRALLAYLAVVDQPQSRQRLCGLFWDAPDDLRAALRWSLSKIRKVVNVDGQEVLLADHGQVTLLTHSIALDLRQVRELSQRLASADIAELEQAAHALEGGFLEDLSLPRCREFESWRLSLASEVNLLRATVLRTLVDRLASDPSRALRHALALRAMDPANSALAAEVKAVADAARELVVKAPSTAGQDGGQARQVAATPAESPSTASKRHDATILSVEIVSPLPGFASVAPDAVFRQLDPLFELAQTLIARHGGVVAAIGGSSITALFDAATCDNDAAVACRAALAVKSIIESESARSVRVRAGLDSGEVVVRYRRHGQTERIEVAGAALRTADRLVESLRRGLLALTDRTQLRAAGLVATRPLPQSELFGFGRERIHELLGGTDQTLS
jgi:DNA-binding SARP family transcriptional activator/class 3 adenylate cyclase